MPPDPATIDDLIQSLTIQNDHQSLFYAKLLKKRTELGVSPFPRGPASDLPAEFHDEYESAIRAAAREVGRHLLALGDLAAAWPYFRMIQEPEPVRAALAAYAPPEEGDIYPVVEIAWSHGLAPERGFDLVLDRSGLCSAVTMVQSRDLRTQPAVRDHCVGRLIRALHHQLTERLRADLEHRGHAVPPSAGIAAMLDAHPEVMAEENYHVDVSHLASVVQLAMQLPPESPLDLALELCHYGRHLDPSLRGDPGVPFERTYDDYEAFLLASSGRDVESGLAHFRQKLADCEATDPDDARFVAEVVVTLLDRAGRTGEALGVARQYLAGIPPEHLTCAAPDELARRAGDYAAVEEIALEQDDVVTAFAARWAAGKFGLTGGGNLA